MTVWRSRFGALLGVMGLSVACSKVIGADFDDVAPLETQSCKLAKPPARTITTPSGGDVEAWLLASSFRFGEDSTGEDAHPPGQGYDLDGVCTAAETKKPCGPAAYTGGDPADGPGGVDNAVARLVLGERTELNIAKPPVDSETVTAGVRAGKFAPLVLLHISQWTAYDDDQVRVDAYVPIPANLNPDGAFTPKLDGTDTWPVLDASYDGSGPKTEHLVFTDENAYVTGRQVVARFSKLYLPLVNSYFEGHDVILTGTLNAEGAGFTMPDGLLAGWSPADQLLVLLAGLSSAIFAGNPLCTNLSIYAAQMKPFLCGKADMLIDGKPGDVCNGFSFGVGFETVGVKLGKPAPAPVLKKCPAEFDPANDTCATAPVMGDGGEYDASTN